MNARNPMATAMVLRIEEARKHPLFEAGVKAANRVADGILSLPQEEALKVLRDGGGWTKMLRGAFDAVVKSECVPGPFNAVIPLRMVLNGYDIQEIRNQAIERRRTA